MKIAIIGSGISGLSCAYKLYPTHDIQLFEAKNYLGGHTNTLNIQEEEQNLNIDTGFIVFNKINYPNLVKLFEKLQVALK